MGKDRNGVFHPGKGKPSGANKEEGLGAQSTPPEKMKEYLEISDKYTTGPDELSPNLRLLHHNRNTSKANTSRGYGTKTSGKPDHTKQQEENGQNRFAGVETASQPTEMPGILTREAFKELGAVSANHCISIYIPTHEYGTAVNEMSDSILFKNKLQEASKKLLEKGMKQPDVDKLLGPAYSWVYDTGFWRNQLQGFAVFLAPGFCRYIKMPAAPPELLIVNTSFQLSPLVPSMLATRDFYLLLLSKHATRLYKYDTAGINEVKVAGLETLSSYEAPDIDNGEHRGVDGYTNSADYLKAIDDIIFREVLNTEKAPLVLAGTEEMVAEYRTVSAYKHLYPEAIIGNHTYDDLQALCRQARNILQPYFDQELDKAKERYANESATRLTSSIVADVVPAAFYGQVDTLFAARDAHSWGTFDEMNNVLKVDDGMNGENDDLVDKAVVKTIANGGRVFILPKEQMPADSPVAALMRY